MNMSTKVRPNISTSLESVNAADIHMKPSHQEPTTESIQN